MAAADTVRVILPVDPGRERILSELTLALRKEAQQATSPLLREGLTAAADDTAQLQDVARLVAADFASGQVAAVAVALYEVDVTDERVTIAAITAEIVPQYAGIGVSIDHEKGHAIINEEIARACGRVVAQRLSSTRRGESLEAAIRNELWRIGGDAHDTYHAAVNPNPPSNHSPFARKAAEVTIAAYCA